MQCTFDASTASDDAGIVSYTWNWGNGRTETRSTPIVKNTFATQMTYSITLTVTDAGGLTNSITKQVAVPSTTTPPANQAPVASISSPAATSTVAKGQNVTFSGNGNDPESGALSGVRSLHVDEQHRWRDRQRHFVLPKNNLSAGTHTIHTHGNATRRVRTGTASVTHRRRRTAQQSTADGELLGELRQPGVSAPVCVRRKRVHRRCREHSPPTEWELGQRPLRVTHNGDDQEHLGRRQGYLHVVTLTVTDGAGLTSSLSKSK